jgi:hypothetical protein
MSAACRQILLGQIVRITLTFLRPPKPHPAVKINTSALKESENKPRQIITVQNACKTGNRE